MLAADVKLSFILHLFLALLAVAGAAAAIFQTELLALLCPIVVFLLPLLALLMWIFRKIRGIRYTGKLRRYFLGFRIAAITGWCISLLPGLFWGAILFHIFEPWPFSLRQGPDTAYAEAGLNTVLGFRPETEISQIYYKGYEIRDFDRYLRFSACSKALEDKIVLALKKEQSGKKPPSFHLNSRLPWWFTAPEAAAFEHWVSDFKEVWVDRRSCTFYVRHWTT